MFRANRQRWKILGRLGISNNSVFREYECTAIISQLDIPGNSRLDACPVLSSKRFDVLYVGIAQLAHIGNEPWPRHKYAGREPVGFCFLFLNKRFDPPLAHVLFCAALIPLMPRDQEMPDLVGDGKASTPPFVPAL